VGKIGHPYQGAAWKFAVWEHFVEAASQFWGNNQSTSDSYGSKQNPVWPRSFGLGRFKRTGHWLGRDATGKKASARLARQLNSIARRSLSALCRLFDPKRT
jgi:hypothetical protein